MRMMMMAGAATVMGGGAYLSGAFEGGEYYAMAPKDVEARLAALDFGAELGGTGEDAFGGGMRLALRSRGPALLRWDLMIDGRRTAEVRAHLAPAEPGTRVDVKFQFTDGEGMMGLEEDPLVNDFARMAMEEKIDSTLDGRAFDGRRLQARMAAAIAANPGAVADMQRSIHENVAREMDRIGDDAYYAPPPSPRASAHASGQSTRPRPPKAPWDDTHGDGGWGKN